MWLFAAIFVAWFVFGGVIGFEIGYGKGLGTTGFWLGGLLGFIGWIVVAVMEPSAEVRTARNRELAMAFSGIHTPPLPRLGPSGAGTTPADANGAAHDEQSA
jgi:hypothetical protein